VAGLLFVGGEAAALSRLDSENGKEIGREGLEAGFSVFGIETWVFESEQLEDKYN